MPLAKNEPEKKLQVVQRRYFKTVITLYIPWTIANTTKKGSLNVWLIGRSWKKLL